MVSLVGAGAALGSSLALAGRKGPPEAVTRLADTSQLTTWRIDRPDIKQEEKQYRQIVFKPGDRVVVQAGGCTRRGGFPPPNGPAVPYLAGENLQSGEKIYEGTIYIPGVTPFKTKQDVASAIGTHDIAWTVNDPNMFLTLGFHDNDYSDNNYNDIDDIDSGPCKGLGYAFVQLEIHHGAVPRGGGEPPASKMPMNLVWDREDDNGLPLDPSWQWEKDRPGTHPDPVALCDLRTAGIPNCTSQPISEDSTPNVAVNTGCNIVGATGSDQNAGHRNWGPATVTGSVTLTAGYSNYLGASAWVGWDADMDFLMKPRTGTGIVKENADDKNSSFSMEFDGEEVLFDHSKSSFWWSQLYGVEDDDRAKAMFNPGGTWSGNTYTLPATRPYDDSVVVGLVGLDCRHDCFAELHPVYAMAAHLDATSTSDDQWAVFARNWGDEGSCGGQDHQIELQTIALRIPRKGATGVTLAARTQFRSNTPSAGWSFSPSIHNPGTDDAYAVLTMQLPPADQKGVVLGELHLAWTGSLRGPSPLPSRPARDEHDEAERPTRGDARVEAVVKKLPAAQQPAYRAALPGAARPSIALTANPRLAPAPQHKAPWQLHKAVSNAARTTELNTRARALCTSLAGKVDDPHLSCKTLVPPKAGRGAM